MAKNLETDLIGERVELYYNGDSVKGTIRAIAYDREDQQFMVSVRLDNNEPMFTLSVSYVTVINED